MEKSLLDVAFEVITKQKGSIEFAKLWELVCQEANLSPEEATKRISKFYTNLMLDGRFVTLGENTWDLRTSHTFDKVHIDMKDVYSDVESDERDSEEQAEDENEFDDEFKNIENDSEDDDSEGSATSDNSEDL